MSSTGIPPRGVMPYRYRRIGTRRVVPCRRHSPGSASAHPLADDLRTLGRRRGDSGHPGAARRGASQVRRLRRVRRSHIRTRGPTHHTCVLFAPEALTFPIEAEENLVARLGSPARIEERGTLRILHYPAWALAAGFRRRRSEQEREGCDATRFQRRKPRYRYLACSTRRSRRRSRRGGCRSSRMSNRGRSGR
jgi:hypothetical protein